MSPPARRASIYSGKPPYSIPSTRELRGGFPLNGLTVASTFTGAGGSCLGWRWAGFRVVYANEFVPEAATTYRANFPGIPLSVTDVRRLNRGTIMARSGPIIDVLEGSPPCASFSMAGSRQRLWGTSRKYSDVEQATDDLFGEYARLVDELRPRAFVMENVPGVARGKAKGHLLEMLAVLRELGYQVEARILDASYLGVPQIRQRLFLVGFERPTEFRWPVPLPYRYSLWEAIGDLQYAPERFEDTDIRKYALYREWDRTSPGGASKRYFQLKRERWDRPARTVTARGGYEGVAGITHPNEPRKFTLAELRRISGFPDDFKLTGSYGQGYERLGRAVPPPVAHAIACAVKEVLL